jgi:hypothetical protein
MDNYKNWWYCAVIVDWKNTNQIRIACYDNTEHKLVKQVAEAKIGLGAHILCDKLYLIKVDNIKQIVVLDKNDKIRAGVAEAFSKENKTTVAKIIWLSKRDSFKAYSLMVVYLTKGSNILRLLTEGFFYAGGESGTTSTFEH